MLITVLPPLDFLWRFMGIALDGKHRYTMVKQLLWHLPLVQRVASLHLTGAYHASGPVTNLDYPNIDIPATIRYR